MVLGLGLGLGLGLLGLGLERRLVMATGMARRMAMEMEMGFGFGEHYRCFPLRRHLEGNVRYRLRENSLANHRLLRVEAEK